MSKHKPTEDQKEVIRIREESSHRYEKDLYIDVEGEKKIKVGHILTWTPPKTEGWVIDRYEKEKSEEIEKMAWNMNQHIDCLYKYIERDLKKYGEDDWTIKTFRDDIKRLKGVK